MLPPASVAYETSPVLDLPQLIGRLGGIRTPTARVLSASSLPLDYEPKVAATTGIEPVYIASTVRPRHQARLWPKVVSEAGFEPALYLLPRQAC